MSARRRPGIWKHLWHHRAAMVALWYLGAVAAAAVVIPWLLPARVTFGNLANNLAPPSPAHLLGTDELGRDLFFRIMSGGRVSLSIGAISVTLAAGAGVLLGLVAGYYQKGMDAVIMRGVDLLLAFPSILLAIFIVSVLGPGLRNAMIAIGISQIPVYVRLTRVQVMALRQREFVEASRAIGGGDLRIVWGHILPNALSPLIVQASLSFGGAILAAAYLGFLGLGVQLPTAEWGAMLSKARVYLRTAPHVVLFPGLAIFLTVLACNLVGDGLRDALDPRTILNRARTAGGRERP
ncbi:MAG: ABC transporter permease [Armatimonadota bacterium]